MRVGKDRSSWQELECYLFTDMLICVKEKKGTQQHQLEDPRTKRKLSRCALKGSILIKKHLRDMEPVNGTPPIVYVVKLETDCKQRNLF